MTNSTGDDAEVIVLGDGIIGSSIARELTAHGARVLVIDPGGPCSGTSGRCDGNVLVQTKHDPITMQITRHGIATYQRWQKELPDDIHFNQHGTLVFFPDDSQLERARERLAWLRQVGVDVELIDDAELARREPALAGRAVAALDCADDASVYPPGVVAAMTRDAHRRGARLVYGDGAATLLRDGAGRTCGVRTHSGAVYHAPWVVNAMGLWSVELDTGGAVPLPIVPRQGVLVVTQALPGLVRRPITEAVYMDNRAGSGHGSQPDYAFLAEPTFNGNLLVGSIRRFAGRTTAVEPSIAAEILHRSMQFIPELGETLVIRSFAGLRPWTPDNRPIIGESTEIPGYVLATGHEGEGIGLAPMTATLVVDTILGLPESDLLSAAADLYRPDRFGQKAFIAAARVEDDPMQSKEEAHA